MKRDLKRLYRQHGIKFFALPFIVVLLLAALADQRLGGYMDHRAEATELELQRENNRSMLGLDSKIKRSHEELAPVYRALEPQLFIAGDVTKSVNALQEQLRQLLQSLYFDNVQFFDFSDAAKGNITHLTVSARFNGVPQQLPRLQAALAQSPTIVAMDLLEIRVVDDPQRGGKQLAITTRFVALHTKPLPELPASAASKRTDAKP